MNESMLSPVGLTRKDEILAGMRRAATHRRRRRHAMVAFAAAAPVLAVAVATALALRPSPAPTRNVADRPVPAPAHEPPLAPSVAANTTLAMAHAHFEIAGPEPSTRIRIASGELTLPIGLLDDDTLSAELLAAGRDPGVVRTSLGVVVLATTPAGQTRQ